MNGVSKVVAALAGAGAVICSAGAGATGQVDRDVALTSAVFVERTVSQGGRSRVVIEQPRVVSRGDQLVFVVNYARPAGGGTHMVVTNPLPERVAFRSTADRDASVSVDGGHSWGALTALRVRETDGSVRGARPEDVTHVRWTVGRPADVAARGTLSFRGVVR